MCVVCSACFLGCGAAQRHGIVRRVTVCWFTVQFTAWHCASRAGVVGVCCCTTCVALYYRTNDECNDGDQWRGERTHAVMPRSVAAVGTPVLDSKLFVLHPLVLFRVVNVRCVVRAFFVAALLVTALCASRRRGWGVLLHLMRGRG